MLVLPARTVTMIDIPDVAKLAFTGREV